MIKISNTRPTGLRTRPTQERSRKTFDAILTAASELLIEKGWDGFNTNTLAERAGCRVATLYRYFPDKLAVITTLADTVVAQWDLELAQIADAADPDTDLRELWPRILQHFVALLKTQPAAFAIRQAMQAVPELRAIDQADNQRLAESFASILQSRLPNLPRKAAITTARTLIETAVTIMDLALSAKDGEAHLDALLSMHRAYLSELYANYA